MKWLAILVLMLSATQVCPGIAQSRPAIPRTVAGRPDFLGVWDYATMTPLERPSEFKDHPTLSPEEAAGFEARTRGRTDQDRQRDTPSADVSVGYNEFWVERGQTLAELGGRRLTSRIIDPPARIIDPPDGRLPPLTPETQRRMVAQNDPRSFVIADNPEDRSLAERCFTPNPLISPTPEANYLQIVQTPDYLVLALEKMHETRVVPLVSTPPLPSTIRQHMGVSRGRWEGDMLVIETSHYAGPYWFSAVDETCNSPSGSR